MDVLRPSLVILLFAAILCPEANAQQVVQENRLINPFVSQIQKASETYSGVFPVMTAAEPEGSLIVASGDFYNADISIFVQKERLDGLLPKAEAYLKRIGKTDAVIRVKRGRVVGAIDLELNNYITINGNHSTSTIPLGDVVVEVQGWNLAQPQGVAIALQGLGVPTFRGRTLDQILLLKPSEVQASDTVTFNTTRHWYGLVFALLFAAILVGMTIIVPATILKSRKAPTPVPTPQNFAEVQARYETRKKGSSKFLPLIPMLLFPFIVAGKPAMADMEAWVPPGIANKVLWLPLSMLVILVPVILFSKKARRAPDPNTEPALRAIRWMMAPILIMGTAILLLTLEPQLFYHVQPTTLKLTVFAAAFVPLLVAIVLGVRNSRKHRLYLGAGDPDYDAAMYFAKQAGARVSSVTVRTNSKLANAYAGLFGRIGVTQGLRDKLTPEERRAVIAHEVGHVRHQHVAWIMLLGFLFCGLYYALFLLIGHSSPTGQTIMTAISPFMFFVYIFGVQLLRAPFQKRNEFAADQFALKQIGSFEGVALPLAKIHLINASPYRLRRIDESFSTHPPLLKRLKALEEAARSLGISVGQGAAERIIEEAKLETGSEPLQAHEPAVPASN